MNRFTPLQRNLAVLRELEPSMGYHGELPFEEWQKKARKKLGELLGMDSFKKVADQFAIADETSHEKYREIRFLFQSESDYYVPCHLLIPHEIPKPAPLMICLQGHSTGMHISLGRAKFPGDEASIRDGDRDFAIRAAAEGFCALTVEQRNFGESGGNEKGPDCYMSSMTALLGGRTTIGERVWDVQRAIDVVTAHFSQIDPNRILCMGNSGGGTATFYIACMEDRILGAMPSCSVCSYDESIAPIRHCTCNYIPGIRKYFDMGDLGGLIAPRALVIVAGKEDVIFPIEPTEKTFSLIRSLYAKSGRPDRCRLVVGDGGHRFYADSAWKELKALL